MEGRSPACLDDESHSLNRKDRRVPRPGPLRCGDLAQSPCGNPPGPPGTNQRDEPVHEFVVPGVFGGPAVKGGVGGEGAALTGPDGWPSPSGPLALVAGTDRSKTPPSTGGARPPHRSTARAGPGARISPRGTSGGSRGA